MSKQEHKKTKKFNGKIHHLKGTAYNKADAELMGESAKKSCYNVKISVRKGKNFGYGREPKYGIYVRKRVGCKR